MPLFFYFVKMEYNSTVNESEQENTITYCGGNTTNWEIESSSVLITFESDWDGNGLGWKLEWIGIGKSPAILTVSQHYFVC